MLKFYQKPDTERINRLTQQANNVEQTVTPKPFKTATVTLVINEADLAKLNDFLGQIKVLSKVVQPPNEKAEVNAEKKKLVFTQAGGSNNEQPLLSNQEATKEVTVSEVKAQEQPQLSVLSAMEQENVKPAVVKLPAQDVKAQGIFEYINSLTMANAVSQINEINDLAILQLLADNATLQGVKTSAKKRIKLLKTQ